jgi:CheY-like chemotaxis protein
MPTHVLIIDADESFAALLKEGLEANREFRVVTVRDGTSALAALQSNAFDLIVLDLGLEAPDPATMLRAVRGLHPDVPVMVIPVDGDQVPQELVPFEVRGVLTKPFFLPELPVRVAQALGRPLPEPAALPSSLASRPAPASLRKSPARALPRIVLPRDDPRVADALRALAESLNAVATLLTEGRTVLAQGGQLPVDGAQQLAEKLVEARAASDRASWVGAGREHMRYGQSLLDGGEHLVYSIDVAEGLVLTVAVRPDSSLRIVRAQCRQTADGLLALGR